MRRIELFVLSLVLLSYALGAFAYNQMPERMASHWNGAGEVDGYMPRFWGVFIMPVLSSAIVLFLMAVPRIDPLKANIEEFRGYYDRFIVLFTAFMLLVYGHTLLWNAGLRANPMAVISPGIGFLFYYAGVLCEKSKRNWFIGVRTPWTMSSDRVWEKTNRLCGRLFKAAGVIALAGALYPGYAAWLILAPALLTAAYAVAYSYVEYKKEPKA